MPPAEGLGERDGEEDIDGTVEEDWERGARLQPHRRSHVVAGASLPGRPPPLRRRNQARISAFLRRRFAAPSQFTRVVRPTRRLHTLHWYVSDRPIRISEFICVIGS